MEAGGDRWRQVETGGGRWRQVETGREVRRGVVVVPRALHEGGRGSRIRAKGLGDPPGHRGGEIERWQGE